MILDGEMSIDTRSDWTERERDLCPQCGAYWKCDCPPTVTVDYGEVMVTYLHPETGAPLTLPKFPWEPTVMDTTFPRDSFVMYDRYMTGEKA